MTSKFFDKPILNSPYEVPTRHWELDENRNPTGIIGQSRRPCTLVTPVPKPKMQSGQEDLMLGLADLSTTTQQYDPVPIINEVRSHLESWRNLPVDQCGVTPVTARLLRHWREHPFQGQRPFFCQVEAVETAIWLSEVAGCASGRGPARYRGIREHLHHANDEANPELLRIALKLATGAGKTTVMALLIIWQTLNAIRQPNSRRFTRGFLVVTPGITIRDRLRVLQPNDPDSYYGKHELAPKDMLPDLGRAKIVITNYHTFRLRERTKLAKGTRALLEGHGAEVVTVETEGQMLKRACGDLMGMTNILVLNDEAHHCYREKADVDEEDTPASEEGEEAKKNTEAARLWISGIEDRTAQTWRPHRFRPFGDSFFPERVRLSRRDAVSLDDERLLAARRHRMRHSQAATGTGSRQHSRGGHAALPGALEAHRADATEERASWRG